VFSQTITPQIIASLPLDAGQPRFAPDTLRARGCLGVELYRWQVAPLSGAARRALRDRLSQAGLNATFIASAAAGEAGEGWSLDSLREAFELGGFFGAEGVVTTTPPRGSAARPDDGQTSAAQWLNDAHALAKASALPLLVENAPGTWAGASREFNQFIGQADSRWLHVAFNPAGFAALREHPFLTAFMSGRLKSRMHLLRIQDAAFEDGRSLRVDDGNAEIAELVSASLARGYAGFFGVGNSQSGFEDLRLALDDFGRLLAELGLESIVT
jgi:sugar phosphate isomerase/epimerase